MVRFITLVGKYAGRRVTVDAADYDDLKRHRWGGHLMARRLYATAYMPAIKKQVLMHRYLMGGKNIDHVDGNTMNNTRKNLRRFERNGLNIANSPPRPHRTCKYRGVTLVARPNPKYMAQITVKSKVKFLGHFATQKEAALAYDKAAHAAFGEFATLNFPESV